MSSSKSSRLKYAPLTGETELPDMTTTQVKEYMDCDTEYCLEGEAGDVPWCAVLEMDYLTLTGEKMPGTTNPEPGKVSENAEKLASINAVVTEPIVEEDADDDDDEIEDKESENVLPDDDD